MSKTRLNLPLPPFFEFLHLNVRGIAYPCPQENHRAHSSYYPLPSPSVTPVIIKIPINRPVTWKNLRRRNSFSVRFSRGRCLYKTHLKNELKAFHRKKVLLYYHKTLGTFENAREPSQAFCFGSGFLHSSPMFSNVCWSCFMIL